MSPNNEFAEKLNNDSNIRYIKKLDAYNAIKKLMMWKQVYRIWSLAASKKSKKAQRDAYDKLWENILLMRAELHSLTTLLINNELFTYDEYVEQLGKEAEVLDTQHTERFPGFSTTETSIQAEVEAKTLLKLWRKEA